MKLCTSYLGCSAGNHSIYSTDGDLSYLCCNDCGLIWRSEDSVSLEKEYDQSYFDSKNYADRRAHKVEKSGWLIDIARRSNSKIENLLEIGCSIGYTLEAAKKRDINHLGIDISEYAVSFCQSIGLNAEQTSLEELVASGNKYQLVFMQHVLEHFQNPFETLKTCFDLLDKKGCLVILVPNSSYNRAKRLRGKHRFYSKEGVGLEHFVYFNYKNMKKVLESVGFELVQENYPLFMKGRFSLLFFLNRFFRKMLSIVGADQEIFVVAQKK